MIISAFHGVEARSEETNVEDIAQGTKVGILTCWSILLNQLAKVFLLRRVRLFNSYRAGQMQVLLSQTGTIQALTLILAFASP